MLSPPLVESKHALKDSVNSVCSVRDNTPQRLACVSSHRVCAFSFSQSYTEEQNTQAHRRWWPLPLPLPEGKGSDYRDTPIRRMCVSFYYLTGCLVGVTSHTTPLPAGEGLGEGPLSCGLEMCAKNLRELCVLCER